MHLHMHRQTMKNIASEQQTNMLNTGFFNKILFRDAEIHIKNCREMNFTNQVISGKITHYSVLT